MNQKFILLTDINSNYPYQKKKLEVEQDSSLQKKYLNEDREYFGGASPDPSIFGKIESCNTTPSPANHERIFGSVPHYCFAYTNNDCIAHLCIDNLVETTTNPKCYEPNNVHLFLSTKPNLKLQCKRPNINFNSTLQLDPFQNAKYTGKDQRINCIIEQELKISIRHNKLLTISGFHSSTKKETKDLFLLTKKEKDKVNLSIRYYSDKYGIYGERRRRNEENSKAFELTKNTKLNLKIDETESIINTVSLEIINSNKRLIIKVNNPRSNKTKIEAVSYIYKLVCKINDVITGIGNTLIFQSRNNLNYIRYDCSCNNKIYNEMLINKYTIDKNNNELHISGKKKTYFKKDDNITPLADDNITPLAEENKLLYSENFTSKIKFIRDFDLFTNYTCNINNNKIRLTEETPSPKSNTTKSFNYKINVCNRNLRPQTFEDGSPHAATVTPFVQDPLAKFIAKSKDNKKWKKLQNIIKKGATHTLDVEGNNFFETDNTDIDTNLLESNNKLCKIPSTANVKVTLDSDIDGNMISMFTMMCIFFNEKLYNNKNQLQEIIQNVGKYSDIDIDIDDKLFSNKKFSNFSNFIPDTKVQLQTLFIQGESNIQLNNIDFILNSKTLKILLVLLKKKIDQRTDTYKYPEMSKIYTQITKIDLVLESDPQSLKIAIKDKIFNEIFYPKCNELYILFFTDMEKQFRSSRTIKLLKENRIYKELQNVITDKYLIHNLNAFIKDERNIQKFFQLDIYNFIINNTDFYTLLSRGINYVRDRLNRNQYRPGIFMRVYKNNTIDNIVAELINLSTSMQQMIKEMIIHDIQDRRLEEEDDKRGGLWKNFPDPIEGTAYHGGKFMANTFFNRDGILKEKDIIISSLTDLLKDRSALRTKNITQYMEHPRSIINTIKKKLVNLYLDGGNDLKELDNLRTNLKNIDLRFIENTKDYAFIINSPYFNKLIKNKYFKEIVVKKYFFINPKKFNDSIAKQLFYHDSDNITDISIKNKLDDIDTYINIADGTISLEIPQ